MAFDLSVTYTFVDRTLIVAAEHNQNMSDIETWCSINNFAGTSFPSSPSEGQWWYKTDENKFYTYNGASWVEMGGGGGGYTSTQQYSILVGDGASDFTEDTGFKVNSGQVTTGSWGATAIGVTKGGTGLTSVAQYDILYADAANSLAALTKVNSALLVTNGSGLPGWDASLKTNYDTAYTHTSSTSNPHTVTKSQILTGNLIVNADVDGSAAIASSKLADGSKIHDKLHNIDSASDHNGVSGAVENNFISFTAGGLPKDSGKSDASYEDAGTMTTHEGTYTHTDIATNTAARHTQNTDTGTTSNTFVVNSDGGEAKITIDPTSYSSAYTLNKTKTDNWDAAASASHTRLHNIDSATDHNGVSGATENNFISFDANGLPKDSGKDDSDYEDAGTMTTHESTYTHSNIALNTTHRSSSGTDHSLVISSTQQYSVKVADASGGWTEDTAFKINAGSVTSGTWGATAIGVTKGGTGLTTVAQYDLLYADAANSLAALNKVNSAILVTNGSGLPGWDATLKSNYDSAYSAMHTQNTDTGTTSNTFVINSDGGEAKLTLDPTSYTTAYTINKAKTDAWDAGGGISSTEQYSIQVADASSGWVENTYIKFNDNTFTSDTNTDILVSPNGSGRFVLGKVAYTVTAKTGTATLTLAEAGVVHCTASSGYTLTLPTAVGNAGLIYKIVKTDNNSNVITVDGDSSETINGATTYTNLNAQWKFVEIESDGSNWLITSEGPEAVGEGSVPSSTVQYSVLVGDGASGWAEDTNFKITSGAVTTGSWTATAIGSTKGGTGLTSFAQYSLLYASTANTWAEFASAADSVLITNGSNVPSWSSTKLSNWDSAYTASHTQNSDTGTTNDTFVVNSDGGNAKITIDPTSYTTAYTIDKAKTDAWDSAGISSTQQYSIQVADASGGWTEDTGYKVTSGAVTTGSWTATAIGPTYGGTGLTSFAVSSLLYASSANTWAALATANNAVLITDGSGVPSLDVTSHSNWDSAYSHISADGSSHTYIDQDVTSGANSTFGNLTITSFAANWTNAGRTVADLGSITTCDINGGTIDGATIATSDVTVGAGKTLDVSGGTLTLANDQISGDKIDGGTIGSTTITTLTITSFGAGWTNAGNTIADLGSVTTCDINGGTIDGISSLTSSGDLDIGTHGFRANTLTADGLTSGRLVVASTNGLLADATVTESSGALGGITTISMSGNLTMTGGGTVTTSSDGDLTLDPNGTGEVIVSDTLLKVGEGADVDIMLYANNGDANLPNLRYLASGSKWQFSNNGTSWTDMGGGGGYTSTEQYSILVGDGVGDFTENTYIKINDNTITSDDNTNIIINPNGTGYLDIAHGAAQFTAVFSGTNSVADPYGLLVGGTYSGGGGISSFVSSSTVSASASSYVGIYTQTIVSSGTTTVSKGVQISNPSGAGSITDCYGLYINHHTKGSSTNYDIFGYGGLAVGTNADYNIDLTPGGTGEVNISKVDIDSGTIDGCTIATSDVTVGSGKTLDVSGGTLTLADNQISGDKVEGGTINATTITTLTSTTVNATTFDTNVAAAAVTLAGTTLSADGTDTDISINVTPKGTGSVVMSKVDINGGTVDGITALTASGNLDIGAYDLRAQTLTADGLTSGRLVVASTNGLLADATVTESSGALGGITTISMSGNLTLSSGGSVVTTSNGDITLQPNGTGGTIIYAPRCVVTSKSTTCTLTVAEAGLILVSASSGWTCTLPAASGNTGLKYSFCKTDNNSNAITLDGNGSETINGSATQATVLDSQWDSCTVICDGSNWVMAT